jgi:SAM-dependent methyltransferase
VTSEPHANLLSQVADYYSRRLEEYGTTPRGVDWNGSESQALRFDQLKRLFDGRQDFTLADIGCGYGALLEHLGAHGVHCDYVGTDVSSGMIAAARNRQLQVSITSSPAASSMCAGTLMTMRGEPTSTLRSMPCTPTARTVTPSIA